MKIFLNCGHWWGMHISNFFTFLIFFTCWTTVEWSTLIYLATSCVVARGSVLLMASVVVNFWWLATVLFIFKALVSSAKLLEPPLHCALFSSSWAKYVVYIVDVLFSAVSTSHALMLNMWNVAKQNSKNNRILILIKHYTFKILFRHIKWLMMFCFFICYILKIQGAFSIKKNIKYLINHFILILLFLFTVFFLKCGSWKFINHLCGFRYTSIEQH